MSFITFCRSTQSITYRGHTWECRDAFFDGYNSEGQARESLPVGTYTATADEPPAENSAEYGTFYISTGDARGRDIHGGGSDRPHPLAPRQGWYPTLGCLRMQNEDGEELSRLMIEDGNEIELVVQE